MPHMRINKRLNGGIGLGVVGVLLLLLVACSPQPIHEAAESGDVERIARLLASDPTLVSAKERRFGSTPLMLAAAHHHVEAVKLLLKHGARVQERDRKGFTVIDYEQGYLRECSPESRKIQEEMMRRQGMPEEKIREQVAKIDATKRDGETILALLMEALQAERAGS